MTGIQETQQSLDDIWKEKKKLRRTSECIAIYLKDHQDDKSVMDEHAKMQLNGLLVAYDNAFKNLELVEACLKIHLKDLKEKKKKK